MDADGKVQAVCVLAHELAQCQRLQSAFQQFQDQLNGELRFRTLIGEMFGRLVDLTGDCADGAMRRTLLYVRSFASVDQSSLLQFSDDDRGIRVTQSCPSDRAVWPAAVVEERELLW